MFDIGFSEIALVGVVALIVLGPERLPRVARTAGALVRRARSSWLSVRNEIERELAAEDLRKSMHELKQDVAVDADLRQAARSVETALKDAANLAPGNDHRQP
ncbi:MAG: twin-arginine translocase subunit TatB [Xanthomonadales bacterium]|nr:twin-arginine translocase subunit TatB [Xanthomonadales bacterium]MDL1868185.1 twin-arginine translocase subunit TatB [Gammaproteobacteria bacterium PRO6]